MSEVACYCIGRDQPKVSSVVMQVRASAPATGPAAFDLNADSRVPADADWEPARGENVRLLTMGGSAGQIISGPDAKGRLSVKVHLGSPLNFHSTAELSISGGPLRICCSEHPDLV